MTNSPPRDDSGRTDHHVIVGTQAFHAQREDSNDIWRLIVTLFGDAIRNSDADQSDPGKESLENFYTRLDANCASIEGLRVNQTILTEMILARIVDKFLLYLSDLLRLILDTHPKALVERESVAVERILSAKSLDELKKELIEDRVLALSYKSVTELSTYLDQRLGFAVFPDDTALAIVVKTIETRNIIVHNRAIANARFVTRVGPGYDGAKTTVGQKIAVQPSDLLRMNRYFDSLVGKIDAAAAEKFKLRKVEVKMPRLAGPK